MILSDFDLINMIKSKRLKITPFSKEIIRENGIDFRISDEIAVHNKSKEFIMDPEDEKMIRKGYRILKGKRCMILEPLQQVLLSTYEKVEMPNDIAGFVELRSTWARHGLYMPPTIVDAGFKGTITLEVFNGAPYKIKLKPFVRFAHVVFVKTTSAVKKYYKGYYNMQSGIKLPKKISARDRLT
ncbi:MAG: dCTP deaminase [Candidatus Micrarchaeaceae archaeon]